MDCEPKGGWFVLLTGLFGQGGAMMKVQTNGQNFLANLRQSGLIPVERLDAALLDVPITGRGKPVARALMKKGLLTRFQAQLLLLGRTSGFVLGQYRILDLLGQGGMG